MNQGDKKAALLTGLTSGIEKWTPYFGEDQPSVIEALSFFVRDAPSTPEFCIIDPSMVLVVQGQKRMLLGEEAFIYDESHFLLTSLELPARSEVTVASAERPCAGMVYRLDLGLIAELIARGNTLTQRVRNSGSGLGVGMVTEDLLDAFRRLLRLLEHTGDIPVLAPLIHREIHYLLLQSDQAPMLRQMVYVDGQGYRIARAIDWIKQNFTKPLRIDDLAEQVQMSVPSFHNHFRRLTSMSPLQYQKSLRLHEAKRLMINQHYSASSAAFEVGYESPSQFNREYSRMFGNPPRRDIQKGHHSEG
ncbi:TPA: AraC family transcriptional regulator [Klebsiella quasipneumoniae subsp. quasipneumoniae]|uniref:AraC family transcriptional regulator n=1 Tax=Klebsiella quasipneumoniae TaxID=1463165 RepID=UPI000C7D81F1|nr:AraC family transcriptional regulator [Klebsiella quasipneumoniae]HBR1673828.1 AraC family transcriptional regulator [Klebsiella quasipneumoniae subsp. quasipneumoniae]MBC5112921.1 AraC family transcriptional regulator [Klebsiella quasipneumoniae]MCB3857222.1 AraC family transcriptional regulator [Klebsiella quasipneumoniae]MCZ0712944.1 AraC family transcriptional regulator [Klebsiella quasipneumoniae]PLM40295.1 AraC family transcriptional regulator [Klebsiella quasipneumoniae]